MQIFSQIFNLTKKYYQLAGFTFMLISVFLMSFPRSWTLYPLGAFLFFGLCGWLFEFQRIKKSFSDYFPVLSPFILFFGLFLIYYFLDTGAWSNVEEKLMFLLIPLLGFPLFTDNYINKNLDKIFTSFVAGIAIISIFHLIRATVASISFTDEGFSFNFLNSENISRFTWDQFSTFEHPTYFSIKVLWGISLLLFYKPFLRFINKLRYLLLALFVIVIYLLSVKAAFVILVILIYLAIYRSVKTTTGRTLIVLSIPVMLFFFFLLIRSNDRVEQKTEQVQSAIQNKKLDFKNFDPRARSWYTATKYILKYPVFGVGLSGRDTLASDYRREGYIIGADLRLNAHNQFLETQLAFGIPGTIILLLMLFFIYREGNRNHLRILVFPFLVIVTVSMLFESILVRQWGIMFFIYFSLILLLSGQQRYPQENKSS